MPSSHPTTSIQCVKRFSVTAAPELGRCNIFHAGTHSFKTFKKKKKIAFFPLHTGVGRSWGVVVTSQTCYHGDKVLPAAVGSRPSLGATVTGW